MKRNILTVKSVTLGLKGKKALEKRGIKSSLVKIDSSKSDKGCQYGLEINERDFYEAVNTLREYGINYGVYHSR